MCSDPVKYSKGHTEYLLLKRKKRSIKDTLRCIRIQKNLCDAFSQNVEEQSYLFFTGTAEDLEMPVPISRQGEREEGEVRGRGTVVVEEEGEREGAARDGEREGEEEGTEEDEDVVEGESGDGVHSSGPDLQVPIHEYIAYSSDVDTT